MNTEEPLRINRYLAQQGYGTRRGVDELIQKGLVTVNGAPATVGMTVSAHDTVVVAGRKPLKKYTYLLYHKPVGVVTNAPTHGETDVARAASIKKSTNIQPVGRLDKDSNGLLILTNDTRIVAPLLSPQTHHEKEYRVTVQEVLRRDFEEKVVAGVALSDYRTKPAKVTVHDAHTFSIILTEGKNRQIRRMCAALHYTVTTLTRIRILHLTLGGLEPNEHRRMTEEEQRKLLESLGLGW